MRFGWLLILSHRLKKGEYGGQINKIDDQDFYARGEERGRATDGGGKGEGTVGWGKGGKEDERGHLWTSEFNPRPKVLSLAFPLIPPPPKAGKVPQHSGAFLVKGGGGRGWSRWVLLIFYNYQRRSVSPSYQTILVAIECNWNLTVNFSRNIIKNHLLIIRKNDDT